MPSSNTLTPTWRTARSRAPLPQLFLSHHPPNTHFECCMNLVGGPCPLRSPDTSTSYRVDVCAVFPGPGATQLWLFPGGRPRLSHLPGSYWGVGIWSGMRRTYPPPLSAFLSFNRVVSKRKSSTQGRERKRCQELWEPLPKCLSFLGCVLPGRTSW